MKQIGNLDDIPLWNIVRTTKPQEKKLKDGTVKMTRPRTKIMATVHAPDAEAAMRVYQTSKETSANWDWSVEKEN